MNPTIYHRAPADSARTMRRRAGMAGLLLLGAAAVHVYLKYPLHYLLHQDAASYGSYWPHRGMLQLHIIAATVALVTGPFQFSARIRRRCITVHRWIGLVYLGAVLLGGVSAFALSAVTQSPDQGIATAVFTAAWWGAVGMGYAAVRRGQIAAHREWMIRGYVLTFAFVLIRLMLDLPIWEGFGPTGFPTVVWLGWVLPVLGTELVLQWRRTIGRRPAPVHRRQAA